MGYLNRLFNKGTYKTFHIKQCNTATLTGEFWP